MNEKPPTPPAGQDIEERGPSSEGAEELDAYIDADPTRDGPSIASLQAEPLSSLVEHRGPPPKILVAPYIAANSIILVQGAPGSGKTFFLMYLALQASLPGRRTLLVLEEGARFAIGERFAKVVREPRAFDRVLLVALHRGFRLDDRQAVERLAAELAEGGFELLLLDPFSDMHGIDENDQRAMAAIRDNLKLLARVVAVVLVVHTRKEAWKRSGNSIADARGSGVLAGAADMVLDVSKSNEPGKTECIIRAPKKRDLVDAPETASFAVVRQGDGLELRFTTISDESTPPVETLEVAILKALSPRAVGAGLGKSAIAQAVGRRKDVVLREVDRLATAGRLIEEGGRYWLVSHPGSQPQGTVGTKAPDSGHPLREERVPRTAGTTGTIVVGSPSSVTVPAPGTGPVPGSSPHRGEPGTGRRAEINGVHHDAEGQS